MTASVSPSPGPPDAARPAARFGNVRHYLGLAFVLAEREFVAAFRGNWTGALSTFVVPLLMLATYSFVFSTLIPVRIRPEQSRLDYAFFLFSGLIVWNGVVDVANRAPRLFSESRHYIQRPRFPMSLLVVAPCLATLYRALPWVAAYLLAHLALLGPLPGTVLLIPLPLLWVFATALGVSLLLASLGAWVRDLGDLTPPLFTLLFFLSPVLYPESSIFAVSPAIATWNPLAPGIQLSRDLLFEGRMPGAGLLFRCGASLAIALLIGILAYRGVRPRLPDLA